MTEISSFDDKYGSDSDDNKVTSISVENLSSIDSSVDSSAVQENAFQVPQRVSVEESSTVSTTELSNKEDCSTSIQPIVARENSVEQVRQKFQSQADASSCDSSFIASSELSSKPKATGPDDIDDSHQPSSIVLDAHEKSWIIRSAQADLVEMQILLNADEDLAHKKNGIHWAAKKGNEHMLRMFLDRRVDVNMKTGYTPLHLASINGHERCISLLIDHGANLQARDFSGKRAIDYLHPRAESEEETAEDRSPAWKRHYFSGYRAPSLVSSDLYERMKLKMTTSKLDNNVMRRRCSQKEMVREEKKPRAKSMIIGERFYSFMESPKGTKTSRKESLNKGLWRMPSIRRQKTSSVAEEPIIEHHTYGNLPPPTNIAWKPAGAHR